MRIKRISKFKWIGLIGICISLIGELLEDWSDEQEMKEYIDEMIDERLATEEETEEEDS